MRAATKSRRVGTGRQVWQAVLTKPIDLDSPGMRQQMSDGARSLLKAGAPRCHCTPPHSAWGDLHAAACLPDTATVCESKPGLRRMYWLSAGGMGVAVAGRAWQAAAQQRHVGCTAAQHLRAWMTHANKGNPAWLSHPVGKRVERGSEAVRAGPAGSGRGPAPDGDAGAGARLGAPGRHRARPAAGRHRGARPLHACMPHCSQCLPAPCKTAHHQEVERRACVGYPNCQSGFNKQAKEAAVQARLHARASVMPWR